MPRNCGFSVKLFGVGGMEVVVPSASSWVGGSVGRRERMLLLFSAGSLKMYYVGLERG
jgi:hypothetical protein